MKKILLISAFIFSNSLVQAEKTSSKIDLEAGKAKAVICNSCHGAGGVGVNPEWPKLAGQNAKYTRKQLLNFKSGARKDLIMLGQVAALTDADINNLAAYYESVKPTPSKSEIIKDKETTEKLMGRAASLYRGGNLDKQIAACSSCHGPTGNGNSLAAYPAIAGQYAKYLAKQLKNFRSSHFIDEQSSYVDMDSFVHRANSPNKMMRQAVSQLTDKDIEALANYIQGLQP